MEEEFSMAISQPTYPIVSTDFVSHMGAYTDTREAAHAADTSSVHGIADTSVLATDTEVASAVSTHAADTTAVHGLSDVSKAIGACVYSGGAYPTRPTGYAFVIWQGPVDPGGSAPDTDAWIPTA